MGKRPADFDEEGIRKARTFQKWLTLKDGETLKYACRIFQKGNENDEERLMRRIMIARRNNVRDHEILKKAREVVVKEKDEYTLDTTSSPYPADSVAIASIPRSMAARVNRDDDDDLNGDISLSDKMMTTKPITIHKKPKKGSSSTSAEERMDEAAVKATRSYRAWLELEDGEEFSYNQKYIKGKEGHDFLLKKNIWRRMRYRRENKKIVEKLKGKPELVSRLMPTKSKKSVAIQKKASSPRSQPQPKQRVTSSKKVAQGITSANIETQSSLELVDPIMNNLVATMPPLDAVALEFDGAALDAAYQLAAATANVEEVAAAVAAVIQGSNDDTSTEDEEEENDSFHVQEESCAAYEDATPQGFTRSIDV